MSAVMSLAGSKDVASTQEERAMVDYVSNLLNARYRHTPTTFHKFKSLPGEVQTKILGYVEGQPRILLEDTLHQVVRFAELYETHPMFLAFPQAMGTLSKQCFRVLSNDQQWVNFKNDIIFLNEDLCGLATGLRVEMSDFFHWNISDLEKIKLTQRVAIGYDMVFSSLEHPSWFNEAGSFVGWVNGAGGYADCLMEKLSPYLHADGHLTEILLAIEQRIGVPRRHDMLRLLSISQLEASGLIGREWVWDFSLVLLKVLQRRLQREFDRRMRHESKKIEIKVVCQYFPPKTLAEWEDQFMSPRLEELKQRYPFLGEF